MFQDTVPNSNLRKLSENGINMISTLKAQEFQKQYGKKTVNLWKPKAHALLMRASVTVCTYANSTNKWMG